MYALDRHIYRGLSLCRKYRRAVLRYLIDRVLAKASISARRLSSMSLLAFKGSIGLAPKVGRCSPRLGEETGEDRLDQGAENNLCAICHWERHPEDEDELEDVVES